MVEDPMQQQSEGQTQQQVQPQGQMQQQQPQVQAQPQVQVQQQQVSNRPVYTLGDIEYNEANKIMAILACVPLINLFLLFTERNDKFVRYMASQSIILSLFYLLAWLPGIGWVIALLITIILAAMITMVVSGKRFDFPIVSDEALKLMAKV